MNLPDNDAKQALDELNSEKDNSTEQTITNLGQVSDKYSEIVSKIREIRNLKEDELELSERMLAIEKARDELEKARTERNVKVFNAATGRFEYQANIENINNAQDNLNNAVTSANKLIIDRALKDIENLGNGISDEKVTGIIDKWIGQMQDGGDIGKSDLVNFIQEGVKEETGYEYKYPKTYDRGGILQGIGGIKATSSNEIVLGPDMTNQILSPTSNQQFSRFVSDLGLLFGASRAFARSPEVIPNNINTQSNFNNRNGGNDYYLNGVSIGSDAASRYTLQELFNTMLLTN